MLKEIYAPTGEKFEVPSRKADELQVFHGWTFTPPKEAADTTAKDKSKTSESPVSIEKHKPKSKSK